MGEARAPDRTGAATLQVVLPGAAMIAVTFGLARYGYGLLLPEMRAELELDPRDAGLIASGAYLAYLTGNTAVVWLTARFGPRPPIALASAMAALGMAAIACAEGALGLAVGVLVAGAAAGLAFPPYADVVAQRVPARRRAVAWSAISSGTGWGVVLAGPLAIALGGQWRTVWLVFAAIAALVGVVAVRAAPAHCARTRRQPVRLRWSWFVCPRSRPLLASAVLLGAGSSVWWAFSVDAMRISGIAETPARTAYAVCGAAGVLASATGMVTDRVGLRRCYHALGAVLVVAVALLGLAGSHLGAALISAGLFGVAYNGVVACQGLWSADVFRERPSGGLAAVNTALTIGTITGPALAGLVIQSFGYPVALFGAAALVALAAIQAPPVR
jgi:predicted MFS family arabinose efflux permease